MDKLPVVVNGMGVIGLLLARCIFMDPQRYKHLRLMAGNAPGKDPNLIRNLVRTGHDSRMPRLHENLDLSGLVILDEKDARKIDWSQFMIDDIAPVVIDCSDQYRTRDKAAAHLDAGAGAVILSCPASGPCDGTYVPGVNDGDMTGNERFMSGASCTTYGLANLLVPFDINDIDFVDAWTIHSGTPSDYKTPEGALQARGNITPATSGATSSIEKIFPGLAGKVRVRCMRVPVDDVSALPTEIFFKPGRCPPTLEELEKILCRQTVRHPTSVVVLPRVPKDNLPKKRISPHLSGDFVGCSAGFVVDMNLCEVNPDRGTVSLNGYYANSFGYAWKLAELIEEYARKRLAIAAK